MSEKSDSSVGKWLAGIVASVIAALTIWWLTSPGGPLNPEDPEVSGPQAPAITASADLYDKQTTAVVLNAGQTQSLPVNGPVERTRGSVPRLRLGLPAVQLDRPLRLPRWWRKARDPAPDPQGGGRTETIGQGSSGESTIGYCDELVLFNPDVEDYQVEIRYASGITP